MMLQKTQHVSTYNKERHNGLIVKFLTNNMHTVSVIVFDSGNILVCACKDSAGFKEAYQAVIDIVRDCWDVVWRKDVLKTEVAKRGQKRKLGQKDNFDYGQYIILS